MLITNASLLGDFFVIFFLRTEDCAEDCAEGEVIRNPYKFDYLLQRLYIKLQKVVNLLGKMYFLDYIVLKLSIIL